MVKDIYTDPGNGLNETLKEMKRLEIMALQNKGFIQFVFYNFYKYSRDLYTLARATHSFIINSFVYQNDEHDEDLTAPYLMLKTRRGDCDDMALFTKSIYSALSLPSNYILLGADNSGFTHIAVKAHGGYIVDGTNPAFNTIPAKYINQKVLK